MSKIDRRSFLTGTAAFAAASGLSGCLSIQPRQMLTRAIPSTDEHIPIMGLGSPVPFYSDPPEGPELTQSLVQAMYDMGGRFIDTPAFFRPYPPGAAPPEGQAVQQDGEHMPALGAVINSLGLQDELFLAGKISVRGKDEGVEHMDKLIANLNKRPMDLMMALNMWDMEFHWPTLKQAKEEGKVRYIGASLTNIRNDPNFDRTPIENFMREERPDFFLLGYSMFQNEPEERLLPLAQDLGIAIVVAEAFKTRADGAYFSVTAGKELPEWAAEFDCNSWAQYALKYVASHPAVTTVVTETSQARHVIDNMGAGYGRLPDEAMRQRMAEHFYTLL
ncbi:MAG: aldo/keto reductase [Porticoccaceae bacterium]|nr:aldo/keto reductase [Porticoccaceae bacterium]